MKIFAFLVCFVVFSIYETFGYEKTSLMNKPLFEGTLWRYRIAIIGNNEKKSKVGKQNKWRSKWKKGWVKVHKKGCVTIVKEIKWDKKVENLYSSISSNGRAMEMSELVTFNGKLYTCDEATGIVYQILKFNSRLREFARLKTENGSVYKCKWMTVEDEKLLIGPHDREWVDSNGVANHIYVKELDTKGNERIMKWDNNYELFRNEADYPVCSGYITIEALYYSHKQKKWFVQPRTGSYEAGGNVDDETRGDNKLYILDKNDTITIKKIGPLEKNRRFTSFKFLPESDEKIFLALKVTKKGNRFSTFIEVYDINGNMLIKPRKIANDKYEGLEFI